MNRKIMTTPPVVVVGSGFFGLTIAERIAEELGLEVLVLERRSHIGGNANSRINSETGIEYHEYGSHLFHTSNVKVWDYVNRFAQFSDYRHTVWTKHNKEIYSLPFNLSTINHFFRQSFSPDEARAFIRNQASEVTNPLNFEDKAISLVGVDLYEAFIKGYTQKQWQTDPKLLDANIISRIPVRFDYNNRYFSDTWEGLPLNGYSDLFQKMIQNSKIKIDINIDFKTVKEKIPNTSLIIYSGALDEYYNYVYGMLKWRTIDFDYEIIDANDFQGTSVMNYADLNVNFTRIHEFKHLHPERNYKTDKTLIAKEFSRFATPEDEPYYPVNTASDRETLLKYRELSLKDRNIIFGGRLGSYQYLDMHMAIASAMNVYENQILPRFK